MTLETFKKLMSGVIGVELTYGKAADDQEPDSALRVITCLRYWKHSPPIPVRLQIVLDDGISVSGRFTQELELWKALKNRGMIQNLTQLLPSEMREKLL